VLRILKRPPQTALIWTGRVNTGSTFACRPNQLLLDWPTLLARLNSDYYVPKPEQANHAPMVALLRAR